MRTMSGAYGGGFDASELIRDDDGCWSETTISAVASHVRYCLKAGTSANARFR